MLKYILYVPVAAVMLLLSNIDSLAREGAAPSLPPRGGATISSEIPSETQVPPRGDLEGAPDDKIYETCEKLPEYPGGQEAMFKYLIENVRYPKVAQEYGVQGKVMVSFVVEKDGTLTEVKAVKALDVRTGQELSEMVVVAYNRDQTPEEAKKAEDARHYNEGLAALKAEAVRAVKAMPQRWTPGKDKGKPVRARFILPLSFRLQ